MKTRIWSYTRKGSVEILAEKLGLPILYRDGAYKPEKGDLIINWGSSEPPSKLLKPGVNWLNHPKAVANAVNKLATFKLLDGKCSIPEYTTDPKVVKQWLVSGNKIYARKELTGCKGSGIIVLAPGTTHIPTCPLYTKALSKSAELRVFVFKDKTVIRQKVNAENPDNLGDGYEFVYHKFINDSNIRNNARSAISCLGLTFGAVDMINWEDKSYVLEVNTAPQLQPKAFLEFLLEQIKEEITSCAAKSATQT